MQYTCISADCHIDLIWMPPDLFTGMPDALRYKMTCENAGKFYGFM
jgi:hypothetical protein